MQIGHQPSPTPCHALAMAAPDPRRCVCGQEPGRRPGDAQGAAGGARGGGAGGAGHKQWLDMPIVLARYMKPYARLANTRHIL